MKLDDLLASNTKDTHSRNAKEYARAYVRVSHERSAEKGISPETQRKRIEAYARERGYIIIQWYEDLGISAFRDSGQRTQWNRMLKDAKADPDTSVIIVWRYDRFSRGDDAQTVQRDLIRHGVRIESAEEGYYDPDSETGAIMMPLTWSLNRLFSIKLRNVVIPNMITNVQQRDPETGWAYKNGGWALFGYKKHKVHLGRNSKSMDVYKTVWVLDDRIFNGKTIADWCRTMLVDWRLNERMGYDSIAGRLTAAGVPTPTGKAAWATSSIQSILGEWDRLWQYTGVAFWNREDCTDPYNRKRRDPSEWIVVSDAHPAIITNEEAEAIWGMVESRKHNNDDKSAQRAKSTKWALSGGLLKCAVCGANYVGVNKPAGDYYVCGSHIYRRGAGCSESWYIPRAELEYMVLNKILENMGKNSDSLQAWIDAINQDSDVMWQEYEETKAERKKTLRKYKSQLKLFLELIDDGIDSQDVLDRIKATSENIHELEALDKMEKPEMLTEETISLAIKNIEETIDSDNEQARREILRSFVEEILVDPQTKTLEGRLYDPRVILSPKTQFELKNRQRRGGPKGTRTSYLLIRSNCFHATYAKGGFWGYKKASA